MSKNTERKDEVFPYSNILLLLETEYGAEGKLEITLDSDGLQIFREQEDACPEDNFSGAYRVDLKIDMKNTLMLRDFLNFALPNQWARSSHAENLVPDEKRRNSLK